MLLLLCRSEYIIKYLIQKLCFYKVFVSRSKEGASSMRLLAAHRGRNFLTSPSPYKNFVPMRSQKAHTARAFFVFVRHICALHKIVTLWVTIGKRAKDFKSKANIKFYYVKLRFPMRLLATHTACF